MIRDELDLNVLPISDGMGLDMIRRVQSSGSCFIKVLMNLLQVSSSIYTSFNGINHFCLLFTKLAQHYESKAAGEDRRVA